MKPLTETQRILVESYSLYVRDMARYVADKLEIPFPLVFSRTKMHRAAWTRYIVWHLLKDRFSAVVLGGFFDRDHATVLHGIRELNNIMRDYPFVQEAYDEAKALFFTKPSPCSVRLRAYSKKNLRMDLELGNIDTVQFEVDGIDIGEISMSILAKVLQTIKK